MIFQIECHFLFDIIVITSTSWIFFNLQKWQQSNTNKIANMHLMNVINTFKYNIMQSLKYCPTQWVQQMRTMMI